jgi:uncharacterized GH25 family protein
MLRYGWSVLALFVLAGLSQAHFVWLIPGDKPNTVKLVFSDKLGADVDNPDLVSKVKHAKVYVHDPESKHTDLKLEKDAAALVGTCPDKAQVVRGSCVYGVFQRGDSPPQLLNYYCILKRGALTDAGCFHCQPFQVREEKPGVFLVQYEGDAVADSEVILVGPKESAEMKGKTDKEGRVTFDMNSAPKGLYGLRAKHVVKESGEHEGKKYQQITNYVTLVFER